MADERDDQIPYDEPVPEDNPAPDLGDLPYAYKLAEAERLRKAGYEADPEPLDVDEHTTDDTSEVEDY